MKFRTLALALALACGLTGIGEAKTKRTVVRRQFKPGKSGKKFKAAKVKAPKRSVRKTAHKH
jgi:phage tail tape-measure protein